MLDVQPIFILLSFSRSMHLTMLLMPYSFFCCFICCFYVCPCNTLHSTHHSDQMYTKNIAYMKAEPNKKKSNIRAKGNLQPKRQSVFIPINLFLYASIFHITECWLCKSNILYKVQGATIHSWSTQNVFIVILKEH